MMLWSWVSDIFYLTCALAKCLGDKQNLNPCHQIVWIWQKNYYEIHHWHSSPCSWFKGPFHSRSRVFINRTIAKRSLISDYWVWNSDWRPKRPLITECGIQTGTDWEWTLSSRELLGLTYSGCRWLLHFEEDSRINMIKCTWDEFKKNMICSLELIQ